MLIDNPKVSIYQKACKRESEFRDGHDDYSFAIPLQVQEYENIMKYGDESVSDVDFLTSLGNFKQGLSLGAGGGTFELNLIERGIVDSFHFIDISQSALDQLAQNAQIRGLEHKITTEVQDLNFISLEIDKYDFISVINALHHVVNLEELIYEINKSLSIDGIFFTIDVIGEKKMYRTDVRISAIELFRIYVRDIFGLKTREFIRTNPRVLTNNCPFECIRSHELESILQYYFSETTIRHVSYWPLFFVWGGLIDYDQICGEYLHVLQLFDRFVYENNVCAPNRLLGVYKKSGVPLMSSSQWTEQEIKDNIGVSWFSERVLMNRSLQFIGKFPYLYNFLKKLYFKIR